ncbi:MAG: metal-dependent transcriptional regulator [Christensenellaceae bacterium]|jgi:DtxR family Mn-dependent transcriptional regulator
MKELTESKEHYLKIIHELIRQNGSARVSEIAQKLDVTKASASRAVNELTARGLLYREGKLVRLTSTGERVSRQILEHFEIVKNYLMESAKIDEATATTVACALEHVLDYEQVEQLTA